MKLYGSGAFLLLMLLALSACSPNNSARLPVVAHLETRTVAAAPESAQRFADLKATAALTAGEGPVASRISTPSASPVVAARVTFEKASLLNRVFLYGADLQYSSISDDGFSLILQSIAVGHVPVYFRIVDERLQMLADQRHLFESDVNHPERLIHEFAVVSQDADKLTVEISKASPVIGTLLTGDKKVQPARTSWVRSAEFVAKGQYLMFETSIEAADGSVAEFMETFFPRDAVIPATAKPLLATAELEPLAERYRFLGQGDVFVDIPGKGRKKTEIASRFSREAGKTIDWYVTPNIPTEYLPQIKTGIEGWNRYSQKMWGEDLVAFKGVLPAGIKLGDPRYNVVNWDSIAEAGAAYESQATDPYTGVQTHSLIYLPKAWINIGREYWEKGAPSEQARRKTEVLKDAASRGTLLGRSTSVRCLHDGLEALSLEARYSPDEFAQELLKGVLLHEVGHALGLAHNFKGSLSMDPKDAASAFTTSIMDYNQFQLEKAAYDGLDKATGPLLEYDRQIMSVLYNKGKDVSASDPVVPVCNDDEADDEDGGQDPLCIRYDAGQDPTAHLQTVIDLVKNESAQIRDQRSLTQAIKALATELGDSSSLKSKEDVGTAVARFEKHLSGVVQYYFVSGAQSLAYSARVNIRSLRSWKDAILPSTYVEMGMRTRVADGIRYVAGAERLEAPVRAAISVYQQAIATWLLTTTYVSGLTPEQQAAEIKALMADINKMPESLETKVLSAARTRIFGDLKASEKAPFYMIENGSASLDFERETAEMLARATTDKLSNGSYRPVDERIAAAKSLRTYLSTAIGASSIADASAALQTEARLAKTLSARNNAIRVYRALTEQK